MTGGSASTGPSVARFRLGRLADVGWLAGFPGITPLELHGDLFTARVVDVQQALDALRAAGFQDVKLA